MYNGYSPRKKHTIVDNRDAVVNERERNRIFYPLKILVSKIHQLIESAIPQCRWIMIGSGVDRGYPGTIRCRKVRFYRNPGPR